MSTSNRGIRYDEDFKRTLVNLYQSGGKTQAALCNEYGIAPMTLNRWIKQYSTVETDDGEVLTDRLMRTLKLPRMSTEKPYKKYRHKDNGTIFVL